LFAGESFNSEQVFQSLQHFFLFGECLRTIAADSDSGNAIHQHHALLPVNFPESHFHNFGVARFHLPSDERRFQGQLPMPSVNKDAEPDSPWPPKIEQPVHRSTHGAPGVQHIIHKHDVPVIYSKINLVRVHHRLLRYGREVVAI
jgi:hypothetical protein